MSRFKPSTKWTTINDLILIVLVVAAVNFPAVTHRFGHTDDFRLFFSGDDLREGYLSAGRPLLALAWWAVHDSIRRLDDLAALRLLAIVGVCAVACQLYGLLRGMTDSRAARIALSIGIAMLPSMTELIAWATCCLYPFSALLALWAAMLTSAAVRTWTRNRRKASLLCLGSFCLVLLSAGIYQPTVSWFWLVPLISIINNRFMTNARHRLRLFVTLALGVLQFGGCLFAFKLFFLVCGVEPQARAALLGDPLVKLQAFVRVQIPLALNQWQVIDVNRKPLIAIITIIGITIILAGFVAFVMRHRRRSSPTRQSSLRGRLLLWIGAVTATVFLAQSHWWLLSQTPKDYRTSATLAVGATLLIGWAILQLTALPPSKIWRTILTNVTFLVIGVLAVLKGNYNLDHYWVYPYSRAHNYLVEELAEKVSPRTKYIHLILQKADEGIVNEKNIHAYGRPYTDVEWDWAPPAIIRAALIDAATLNPDIDLQKEINFSSGTGDQPIPYDIQSPDSVVIDMRQVVKYRR